MSVVKPTGSLKDFLDKNKRPSRLIKAVENHLASTPEKFRATDHLHPSEIVKHDWCHRASYYALGGLTVTKSKPPFRLQNVFDEGHYIHDKWQQRFRAMGVLHGRWVCLVCKDTWWDTSPEGCQQCGHNLLRYEEVTLQSDPRLRIQGHADGWIKGIDEDCLIEIKSVGMGTFRMESPRIFASADGSLDEAWRMMRSPFKSHIKQGAMYLELGAQMVSMGLISEFPREIVYLYELKSNQDFKEFVVQRDKETVKPIMIAARDIVRAIDKGVPPSCNLDSQLGCQKCRAYEEVAA